MTRPRREEIRAFIDRISEEVDDRGIGPAHCGILGVLERGEATRPQLTQWGCDFFASIRDGALVEGNFYANSPSDPEVRRILIESAYERETGMISGVRRRYSDLLLDFLADLGVTGTIARAHPSPLGDQATVAHLIAPESFAEELGAYGIGLMIPNSEFCSRMLACLVDRYDFSETVLGWFSRNANLDSDIREKYTSLLVRLIDDPGQLPPIRDATIKYTTLLQDVWDGFQGWRDV